MTTHGALLVNLGSPDSPTARDVRRYLNQFLMDGRVLDFPYLLRRLIVSCFILPARPRTSAAAYRSIWWDEGSPLIVLSERVSALVQQRVELPIALGMRYGRPSIASAIDELLTRTHGELTALNLIALYPHYAMSSVETVEVEVRRILAQRAPQVSLRMFPPFFDHPQYIEALVASAADSLQWDYDHLLFSYHGLPERHLRKTDPTGRHCLAAADCCASPSPAHATCYRHQTYRTTEMFVQLAEIGGDRYSIAYQSRLGRGWLQPFTDVEIVRLARQGIRRLLVICPAFVTDCLETLEEIGIRGRDAFVAAGGEELRLVPCLNDHPEWIETLAAFCVQ
jgi:ferrochelatase